MPRTISPQIVAVFAASFLGRAASADLITSTWLGGSGTWTNPLLWSNGVPANDASNTYVAVIDGGGDVLLEVFQPIIQQLKVGSADSLTADASGMLLISGGGIDNDGSITFDDSALILYADLVLSGSGSIHCTGYPGTLGSQIWEGGGTVVYTLTNQQPHTIFGRLYSLGAGYLNLVNHGLISATEGNGIPLELHAGLNVNTGTLRADGSTLTLKCPFLDNDTGVIEALSGSTVRLVGTTIQGGILRETAGPNGMGEVTAWQNDVVLDGVTIEGGFSCRDATTTHIRNGLDLQGVLALKSTGSLTTLIFDESIDLDGAEIVGIESVVNVIRGSGPDVHLQLGADFLLHGTAIVESLSLTNAGVIDADEIYGIQMDLIDGPGLNFNTGTMRASTGLLSLSHFTLDNSGGLIEAGALSAVVLWDMTIIGGTLRAIDPNPYSFMFSDSVILDGVTFDGAFQWPGGETVELINPTIDGAFHALAGTTTHVKNGINILGSMHLDAGRTDTKLLVDTSSLALTGGGELVGAAQSDLFYGGDTSVRITNGATNAIRGSLNLGADQCAITNDGTVHVDSPLGMTIDPANIVDFANNGTLWVDAGDLAIPGGNFLNKGTVRVDAGRTLTHTGGNGYQQLNGTTIVDGTFAITASTFKVTTGVLKGSGAVSGFVTNSATVAPGDAGGSSAGILTCNTYTQNPNGALEIEIGGRAPGAQHDQLHVNANANLNGTLKVNRINGFVPGPRDEFTVVTAGGAVNGTFAAVESSDAVTVTYGANFVKIKITPATAGADLNNDGNVDAADLAILLGAWGPCATSCTADLDGDGVVGASDLAILLGEWD